MSVADAPNQRVQQRKSRAALVAIIGGLLVFFIKLLGAALTGSVAVFSDALESTVNVVTAALTAWAVALAARPADHDHPYGHDKAENLSSISEGFFIGIAGVLILNTARERLLVPVSLQLSWLGLGVTVLASVINFFLGRFLVAVGRETHSLALAADGQHVLTDVLTSVAVLVGVLLATQSGLAWLDPLVALVVALNLFWAAYTLVRQAVAGLMDSAWPLAELALLEARLASLHPRYLEIHDLRTRTSGPRRFVEFHLIVPGSLSVQAAHTLCDELEALITDHWPATHVLIHVEPEQFLEKTGITAEINPEINTEITT
jgi:cation diffusion facilitator family transporter